jgi:hypothetical protein
MPKDLHDNGIIYNYDPEVHRSYAEIYDRYYNHNFTILNDQWLCKIEVEDDFGENSLYEYLLWYSDVKLNRKMSDYKQKVNNSIQQLQLGD